MELSWKLFLVRSYSDGGREMGEQLTATLLLVDAAHWPDLPFIGGIGRLKTTLLYEELSETEADVSDHKIL